MDNFKIRLVDLARESRYMYWGALLTTNGILLTVFSAVALLTQTNRILIFILIVLSMISCWLLIWNFLCTKRLYDSIAENYETFDKLTDEEKNINLQKRISEGEFIERCESVAQALLFVETVILFLILIR